MRHNILFNGVLAIAAAFVFSSCYDLNELSHNPYEIEDNTGKGDQITPSEEDNTKYADVNINFTVSKEDSVSLSTELADAPTKFRNFLYEGYYNDYQITTNLSHDIYAGYVANNQPKHAGKTSDYNYGDGWSGQRWAHFYNHRSAEYRSLLRAYKFNNNPEHYKNMFYITRIYYVFLALANTDTYGAMPFREYAQARIPETNNVKYDTQEEVYDAMFRMLEQAVDSINPEDASQYKITKDDICYFGDTYKWLRFANTLRLRLALRISNVAPERARLEAENALNNTYGLMQSNSDNMQTVPRYAPVDMGGNDSGGDENVLAMCSVAYKGESVMSWDLEQFYRNLSTGGSVYRIKTGRTSYEEKTIDPRCLVCWYRANMTSTSIASGEESLREDFVGCKRGTQAPDIDMGVLHYSITRTEPKPASKILNKNYWFNYARPTVWLGYSESLFLKAEAALRGWTGKELTQDAESYFRDGVQASMDYYEIDQTQAQSYINGLKVLNDGTFTGGDKEKILEAIITQKWMAVFPNGNEGWADFRRTDYPAIVNQLTNFSGGDVPEGKMIKRLLYPNSEASNKYFNENEELRAVNKQGTRLWWDVADTNDDSGTRLRPNNFR
jgi:hypothetical protein